MTTTNPARVSSPGQVLEAHRKALPAWQWPAVEATIAALASRGEQALADLPDGLEAGDFHDACEELGLPVRQAGDRLMWCPQTPMLDAGRIRAGAGPLAVDCAVQVLPLVDSSNECLGRVAREEAVASASALFVEAQWAGRGRRQRRWQGRFGQSLLMSLCVDSGRPLAELPGVAIVAGVALARCLAGLGVAGIGLKWPNDLLLDGAKVGGILVEALTPGTDISVSAGSRRGRVVIGIGLNWQSPTQAGITLDQATTGLCGRLASTREQLAGALLGQLLASMTVFAEQGIAPFVAGFDRFDCLADRPVLVQQHGRTSHGIARGLTAEGTLRVEHAEGERIYHSAEVTLRPMPDHADREASPLFEPPSRIVPERWS